LEFFKKNGRISNKKLSEMIGINPSSTLERVKKLEERGIIEGYSAVLNTEKLGYQTIVFIQVALTQHNQKNINRFLDQISKISEIAEYYHIAGRYDYMLKVYLQNNKELQQFLINEITSLDNISKTETMLVFEEKKFGIRI
jgi:DNA-binding Lrp family transcriptional regulator